MMKFNPSALERRAEYNISNNLMPGASVAIIGREGLIYSRSFGVGNLETLSPVTGSSLFRLASMTKPVTGAAVLLQAERGLLSLDDEVSKYIPSLAHMTVGDIMPDGSIKERPAVTPIRIVDLLTHVSGLGQGTAGLNTFWDRIHPVDGDTLAGIVPHFNEICLDFEPRTLCGYTRTLAFDCAARIVELTSGLEYEAFLKKNFFDLLETDGFLFVPDSEREKQLVKMYNTVDGCLEERDMQGHNFEEFPRSYKAAGAGLLGSCDAYAAFAEMLLFGGVYRGRRIMSEQSIKRMATVSVPDILPPFFPNERWGIAVRVITSVEKGVQELPVGCYGWSGAYGTHFWIDPKSGYAAVFMKNVSNAGGATAPTAREFESDVMQGFSD